MNPKKKIKTIIIDDEQLAREGLELALKDFEIIDVVALCPNGFQAIKQIRQLNPDVIFLDIQMPRINGFEMLELLAEDAPTTIFVTAFDEYAIKAFESNALDYLLKPVNPKRLEKAILKLQDKLKQTEPSLQNVINMDKQRRKNISRVLVRDGGTVHVIPVSEILWLEAQDDYVAIKTANNVFLKLERLGQLEQQLEPEKFKRIHRSYILNLDYLQQVENHQFAVLKNGARLPISRSGYSRLFND
jgi:two-component system, LytTR family, response regulator